MKTIPVMNVRRHLGALLDQVHLKSETYILERAGKPIAKLCPIDAAPYTGHPADGPLTALRALTGLFPDSDRSRDIDDWLDTERSSWEDSRA